MCGIIGYVGNKDAQPILLNCLKRMEYRGYDSAGISTLDGGKLKLARAAGKLEKLLVKVENKPLSGKIGIGHTRWATHGGPTEKNAHPHIAGEIALIHNGIIENYNEIKEDLLKKKVIFKSETDTEILAQLINKLYDTSNSLESAVYEALERVRGTFGIVVLCAEEPNKLITAKRGSPIVIGLTDSDELFIASDPTALAGLAKEVIYLGENEVAVCRPNNINVTNLKRVSQKITPEKLEIEVQALQKQGYDHFLLKEIMEQPKSIESILRGHLVEEEGIVMLGGLNISDAQIRKISRIQIVACGTAYNAGLLAKYQIERMARIPVDVDVASEFRYRQPVLDENTLAIVISQSGETADTIASLHELHRQNVHVLGLVNVVGSSIAREVDGGVYLHAGPEISVASTKAFTSQVIAAMLVGIFIARKRGLAVTAGKQIVYALSILPKEIENALKLSDQIKKDAKKLVGFDNALYIGRNTLYPIALEGALKLKEISYIHAEAYSSGEMKHGPIALIDKNFLTVNLLGRGPLMEKSISNFQEVHARGGREYVITDDDSYDEHDIVHVKTTSSWTAPLVINVVLQLLAYHIAVARGTDVDHPRNLAKSVTVE